MTSSCIIFVGPGDRDDQLRSLVRARARWNANGSTDYEYVLRQNCYCILGGQPVRVTVRQGQMTQAILISTGQPVPANLRAGFLTVDQLFDLLEDAINQRAHNIRVTYDDDLGFPVDFFIDYSEQIADEERGYVATDYRLL
ncbi:MAG: DUF6174 domain-containing protein [Gemmatimonadota bacterium]